MSINIEKLNCTMLIGTPEAGIPVLEIPAAFGPGMTVEGCTWLQMMEDTPPRSLPNYCPFIKNI